MGIEVSTLAVQVTSSGIKAATDSLNALYTAADKVESKVGTTASATDGLSNSETKAAASSSNYADKLQIKADLLGKNTEQSAAYMSVVKSLSDADTASAIASGVRIDSWKELAIAQAQAIQMNKDYDKSLQNVSETEEQQTTRLRAMAEASIANAQAIQQEVAANRAKLDAMRTSSVSDPSSKTTGSTSDITSRQNAQMAQVTKTTNDQAAATQKLQNSYSKLEAQLDPFNAKLNSLDTAEKQLSESFKAGIIPLERYNELSSKIGTQRSDVTSAQMHDLAKNSKDAGEALGAFSLKTSMAKRELMVMGREIANGDWQSFARSASIFVDRSGLMGTALIVLQNPLTYVAAGLVAVGAAAYVGSQEIVAFNKQMVITGGQAGLSADQFYDLSKSLGQIGGEGQHGAAAVLTEIAASGTFAADQIGMVSKTAIELQETTGKSIGDTIKIFQDLGKDPVDSILKINDTYHFLTASVYEQIKALSDQGDAHKATQLAMEAFANAVDTRTPQIVDNAGLVANAWNGVVKILKEAGNAIMDIGRKQSVASQIATLEAKKASAPSGNMVTMSEFSDSAAQGFSKADQAQLDSLKMQKSMSDENQAATNFASRRREESLASSKGLDTLLEQGNKQLKQTNELNKLKIITAGLDAEQLKARGISKSSSGEFSGGQYDEAKANIMAHGPKAKRGSTKVDESGIKSELDAQKDLYDEQDRLLKTHLDNDKFQKQMGLINDAEYEAQSYTDQVKAINAKISIDQKSADIAEGKKDINAKNKYLSDIKKLQYQEEDLKTQHQQALALIEKKQIDAGQEFINKLETQAKQQAATNASKLEGVGLGGVQKEQNAESLALQKEFNQQSADLEKNKKSMSDKVYQDSLAKMQQIQADMTMASDKGFADRAAAQADWKNGAISSLEDYQSATANVAGQTASLFTDSFKGMEDALTTFVTTGKLSFSGLATSIINDLARMAAKAATSQIFGMLMQMGMSAISGYGGQSASLSGTGTSFGNNAFSSGTSMGLGSGFADTGGGAFADGGAFTNGVVTKPTGFNNSVMGESGPEAIMPLNKSADGSLGVTVAGLGGSGSGNQSPVNINTSINIADGKSSTQTDAKTSDNNARAFADQINQQMKATIAKEMQQGGSLWKMKNNQLGNA